ncbi:Phosphocarrier protein HPr/PTS system IIA component, partial [Saccharomonospora azurea SZMC 14600]
MRVGLVVVSHSAKLAEGIVEVAAQMAPEVTVVPAGGAADGGIGTDYDAVSAAVERANSGAGAVVLYDLGSAQMTAEMVVETLDDPGTAVVVDAPLVEGAVPRPWPRRVAPTGPRSHRPRWRPGAWRGHGSGGGCRGRDRRGADRVRAGERGRTARATRGIAGAGHRRGHADVRIRFGADEADGHSVLAIMSLGARQGDRVVV